MRIAIMQPYVMPYLGYFQMVAAVDEFILLDDVNFIKKGWINRNRVLLNGEPHSFTIPIQGMSQNKWIKDSMVAEGNDWRVKMLAMLKHAYSDAPHYPEVMPFLERLFGRTGGSIADMAEECIRFVVERLQLPTRILRSSELGLGAGLRAQERIVAIAKGRGATTYINSIGGWDLYEPGPFERENIELRFIRMGDAPYEQWPRQVFVPYLSMIDVLMFCAPERIKGMMSLHTLEPKTSPITHQA